MAEQFIYDRQSIGLLFPKGATSLDPVTNYRVELKNIWMSGSVIL
jgi:hypothetical protein